MRFHLAPSERLYGTGSRALPVDRRGYRLELYNQAHYGSQNNEPNLNITLPTVLSSRGYMLFFDHHAPGYLDLGKTDKNVLEYGGEGLTSLSYFVITGRSQAEILERYTALTGRQPLPPRWALGLIQSRFGYKTDTEMQNVASRMRRENFPLDALVLDLYWFGGTTRQGDFTWAPRQFPDPAGMMSSLKQQGIKTILISEPYVMRTSRNDSLVRTQGLVGTTAAGKPFTVASFWAGPASILDVFKPKTRTWMWAQYKRLHDQGAAGWWSDLGEPENHPDSMRHVNGTARAVHNAYGQVWASIFQDNYAKEYPDERVFNLARSGWAGMQRNSVFPWSGDIQRSWSGYQAQIPVMVGMGQGGVGYMHSDAGGFCVGGIDSELYTRWLQMASLCPILRPHGEGVPPEPYYYPEPYKSSVRNAVQLRYQLLPYLYTLAWQNTTTGAPLARSTDFDDAFVKDYIDNMQANAFPISEPITLSKEEKEAGFTEKDIDSNWGSPSADKRYWNPRTQLPLSTSEAKRLANANDQYLLGPNLLVAPVLHPSQRRRNVELPWGNWIDFYSNQTYPGGRNVGVTAPLAHTPLLVRAGAFLPMTAYRPSTAQYRPDTLLLRYYPDPISSKSEFTMYDDDGHSARALEQKQYETLTMSGTYTPTQTDVVLSSKGSYTGQPTSRRVHLLVQRVAAPPTAIYLDNEMAPAEAASYNAARQELTIQFTMKAAAAVSLRGLRIVGESAAGHDPETFTLEAPDNRSFGPRGTTLRYTRHTMGAAPAQLIIRNAQGGLVRSFELDAASGPHGLQWDGLDEQGRAVAPGVYTAQAGEQHQRLIVTQ
nr:TIM-barrel domain-containing protein [Hymenobacter arizonensis]